MYEDMYMWRQPDIERRISDTESRLNVKVCTCRTTRTPTLPVNVEL